MTEKYILILTFPFLPETLQLFEASGPQNQFFREKIFFRYGLGVCYQISGLLSCFLWSWSDAQTDGRTNIQAKLEIFPTN